MGRKNKLLVPEARAQMDELRKKVSHTNAASEAKFEAAKEQGVPLQHGYNGDIKAKDAGKVGGHIGGSMVKELVRMAEKQLQEKNK
ncbi:Small, acid-soluble spore protein, alpha/beta type [Alteribacillus persepolensis]|uniref:Small, acid-soluble spore protein, alpha/beta type n=1 Tax=Alteribacillus persepolensis TaxID=568899 RepID=A0A1G8DST6_9BACI|nr:alpha/beta-type small acid-soluble spore protein [Alteribacillus persepolensis]SDH60766.1 Small, acid-soluble spore protein, alpha/beta type [Alteribacillus persepolensis]